MEFYARHSSQQAQSGCQHSELDCISQCELHGTASSLSLESAKHRFGVVQTIASGIWTNVEPNCLWFARRLYNVHQGLQRCQHTVAYSNQFTQFRPRWNLDLPPQHQLWFNIKTNYLIQYSHTITSSLSSCCVVIFLLNHLDGSPLDLPSSADFLSSSKENAPPVNF